MMKNDNSWGNIAPLIPKTPFPTKAEAHIKTAQMHHNFIGGMAVNEKYLFTSSEDGTAKIWHRKSLEAVQELDYYDSPVNYVALSPDGDFLATADDSNQVIVYQIDRKKIFKPIHTLKGHTSYVSKLSFAGKRLVSASKDGTVRVWDYLHGTSLHILRGHNDWVYALATSPDGKYAISASLNSSLNVWDIEKGILQENLLEGSSLHYVLGMTIGGENPTEKGNREAPNDIIWIGDKVITVAKDIAVWDTKNWQILWYQDTTNRYKIKRINYVASENMLITVGERIEGWNLDTGRQAFSVIGHEGEEIYSATLWNDEILYTGGKKGDVKSWDVKALMAGEEQLQHTSYIYTLAYLPASAKCITTAHDGSAIIYNENAKPLKQLNLEGAFSGKISAVLPHTPTQAVIASEGKIHIIDTMGENIVKSFALDDKLINFDDVHCLSDTKILGTSLSYLPRLIDLETNKIVRYNFPFTPTHFVPFGKNMLFTSYPTDPIDKKGKAKFVQATASLLPPTYKNVKGIDITDHDIKKTSCFLIANPAKMENVEAYWLPEYIKLNERYDKSYPMFAYPVDEKVVVVQYSGGELVVWNIPDKKVILALSTDEEYLMYVFVQAGKLHSLGKSGKMIIYNAQTFQIEKQYELASAKTYAHTWVKEQGLLLFAENDTQIVAWDIHTQAIRFKVDIKIKITKIHLYQDKLFVGSNDGRLFSFQVGKVS